jgi:long-chain fatty acid transport protein
VSPFLTVNADWRWTAWSQVEALGDPGTGFGWDDHQAAGLSCTTRLDEARWLVRGGFSYGRSPIRDDVAFLNGLSPLVAEWHVGLGLGWRPGPHRWDLSVQQALRNTVTDDGSRLGGAGAGTELELGVIAVALGYGWGF